MSDCSRLSDRMPVVGLGRSTWTAEEATHLGQCPSCQTEWELIRVASHLGTDVGAKLDSTGTTRAVLQRLAHSEEETIRRRRSWGFAALASAAAAAVIIWAGGGPDGMPSPPAKAPAVASLQIPLPELENLLPAELNAVLQTLDEPYVGDSADPAAGDTNDEDLENGFDTLEG
jgi:hypothetical protein